MKEMFMAVNQYGHTYHALHTPRKELLARLNRKHAERMYVDAPNGKIEHVGYVIAGEWLRVYQVQPWYGPSDSSNKQTHI